MTNRHVAQLFAQGLGTHIVYQEGGSAIDFKRQVDTPDFDRSAFFEVRGVEMIHPYWDMAILNVDGLTTNSMLTLSAQSPEELLERPIVVVGYPGRDDRNDLDLQDRIFGKKYFVKRLQPGNIRARERIQSFSNTVNALTHDASTLGGNSGSAVIDVGSGKVIALHFGGVYLKANYAVPMYELARDPRVSGLLNFDGVLAPTNDWTAAWQRVEASEATSSRPGGTDRVKAALIARFMSPQAAWHDLHAPSPASRSRASSSSELSRTSRATRVAWPERRRPCSIRRSRRIFPVDR